jgi:hypothetical protein
MQVDEKEKWWLVAGVLAKWRRISIFLQSYERILQRKNVLTANSTNLISLSDDRWHHRSSEWDVGRRVRNLWNRRRELFPISDKSMSLLWSKTPLQWGLPRRPRFHESWSVEDSPYSDAQSSFPHSVQMLVGASRPGSIQSSAILRALIERLSNSLGDLDVSLQVKGKDDAKRATLGVMKWHV